MVVFGPGRNVLTVVEHKGICCFPGAVVNADVDVRFFRNIGNDF
jgi:hypothetical protein